jgi:amino acid transporter
MEQSENSGLKAGAIGLIGAATFGVVMMSPAITIYASFGPTFISAGKSAPLAYILAFLATIPTALSYALCSREHPDSGSAAGWIARVAPEKTAIAVSWGVFFYYFLNFIIQPVTMGVFTNELFSMLGWPSGFLTYAMGAILCCAIPASALYKGITPSSKGALTFLLIETAVVIALCITIALFAPSVNQTQFSLLGFTPDYALSTVGSSGIFQAMIFGIFSFCGYDVISTLAEEAKAPRKLIPQATFLALSIYALLVITGVWLLTHSVDPERVKQVAEMGGMPIREIALTYWGKGAILIPITAITAALGLVIATGVGSSRVLFSLSRRGHGPKIFAKTHPQYQVPWNANHLIMGGGLTLTLLTGALLGPYNTWVWWGTASTFFAMMTYIVVNLCNFMLFRKIAFANLKNFLIHVFVPAAGILVDGYILVKCFFMETWNQPRFAMGKGIIIFDFACLAIGLSFALSRYKVRQATPSCRIESA